MNDLGLGDSECALPLVLGSHHWWSIKNRHTPQPLPLRHADRTVRNERTMTAAMEWKPLVLLTLELWLVISCDFFFVERYKMGRPHLPIDNQCGGEPNSKKKTTWIPCCSGKEIWSFLFSGGRISCHWDGATLGIATNHRSLLSWVWSIPAKRCWVSSGFHSPQHGPTSTENWRFLLKMAPIYPGSR